jgi:hypothetical protein
MVMETITVTDLVVVAVLVQAFLNTVLIRLCF